MPKKSMTAKEFDAIMPKNASKGVKAARMVLVDGLTWRESTESVGIATSTLVAVLNRIKFLTVSQKISSTEK